MATISSSQTLLLEPVMPVDVTSQSFLLALQAEADLLQEDGGGLARVWTCQQPSLLRRRRRENAEVEQAAVWTVLLISVLDVDRMTPCLPA